MIVSGRADSLPLMWSVWPTVFLCLSYVWIVKYAGPRYIYYTQHTTHTSHMIPRYMRGRPPYQIQGLIVGYNLFQTLFSLWGFAQGWQ